MNIGIEYRKNTAVRIVLMRHGAPVVPVLNKLRAREIHFWVEAYNASPVKKEQKPPAAAAAIAKTCKATVCSDLPRSIESAEMLGIEVKYREPLFREAGLPHVAWPSPKLPAVAWAAFLRVLWFFGYSAHGESLRAAKRRAWSGANRLKEISGRHGSVLLVGHAWMNRFIARELLASGWRGPVNPGRKHWEFGVYECSAP